MTKALMLTNPECEVKSFEKRRPVVGWSRISFAAIPVLLLCGCMATTYGKKPFLCPGTESVYAITLYSNTGDKKNDARAEELTAKLAMEKGFTNYKPILRVGYNTAQKYYYIVELNNSGNAATTSFSESVKEIPRVFGRQAEYGYVLTEKGTGKRHLTFTTSPSPLEDFLMMRKRIISDHKHLRIHEFSPENPIPEGSGPNRTHVSVVGSDWGYVVDQGFGFLAIPAVKILSLEGETFYITGDGLQVERMNLADFTPLVRAHNKAPAEVK